jgi:hypothetical protein
MSLNVRDRLPRKHSCPSRRVSAWPEHFIVVPDHFDGGAVLAVADRFFVGESQRRTVR